MAAQAASGSGMTLKTVSRYSADVATGVIHTAKEQEATTIILGQPTANSLPPTLTAARIPRRSCRGCTGRW